MSLPFESAGVMGGTRDGPPLMSWSSK